MKPSFLVKIKFLSMLIGVAFCLGGLYSCDDITNPYPAKRAIPFIDTLGLDSIEATISKEPIIQKVLLEDFTGHECGNCPRAAEKALSLNKQYGDRIVTMGVHVGYFAIPAPGIFSNDYRTEAGNAYNDEWGIDALGLPQGSVNRRKDPSSGSIGITIAQWTTAVQAAVNASPVFDLNLTSIFQKDSILNVKASSKALVSYPNPIKIVVWLTEDSIVAAQKDYSLTPPEIPQYVHRHVLRTAINTTWGEDLSTDAVPANKSFKNYFGYVIPKIWKAKNCHAVVAIYDATDKHIIQVAEVSVK
jgi:hypothetical protein